jgi:hypothetical protein
MREATLLWTNTCYMSICASDVIFNSDSLLYVMGEQSFERIRRAKVSRRSSLCLPSSLVAGILCDHKPQITCRISCFVMVLLHLQQN